MATTPTTTRNRRSPVRLAPVAAAAAAMTTMASSTYAREADWLITPIVDVRETYTDNVRLLGPEAKEHDFVTDLAAGLTAVRNSAGLKFRARYEMHGLAYAENSDANDIVHNLDAVATAALVDDLFFIDGSAAVNQQNISLIGQQPVDNTSITDNRTTVKNFSLSPYLANRFGSTAGGELRYTFSSVDANSGGLSTSRSNGLHLALTSGPAFRNLGWGLNYDRQNINYDVGQSVDYSTTGANLRYTITPQFFLTATAGYDKYGYAAIAGDSPEGPYYTAGFSWRPTDRTSITASAGKRFWGTTYGLDLSLRSRMTLWRVAYNEEITTTQSQFSIQPTNSTSDFLNQLFSSSIQDPVLRQQAVDRFILSSGLPTTLSQSVNYFTNDFFLQKSLQASIAITGIRNTVLITLADVKRDAETNVAGTDPLLGAGSLALNANTRQTGGNVTWDWRVGPLTSANFGAGHTRTVQLTTDIREKLKFYRAALTRRIAMNVNGAIEFRRQNRSSDFVGADYVENAVSVLLSMRF